ncbi:MAG: hypothetical protein AB3X44_13820 [Leptothrix sp. (in: b-proteobacteria)]
METAFVTQADIRAAAHIATRSIGAEIGAPGSLPIRRTTVTAEVLARLLAGERMAGLDAVSSVSTTRLAAVIEYLQRRYAWRIDRFDKAAGCEDGRVARVAVYFPLKSSQLLWPQALPPGAPKFAPPVAC